MAYSTPLTAIASTALTAAQWNASVRDNLLETPAAKATTANTIFVGTGVNAIAERVISEAVVDTTETTASTAYTSLATNGPSVTATTGTKAMLWVTAMQSCTTSGTTTYSTWETSGATTTAAADSWAYSEQNTLNYDVRASVVALASLTAGSNVFRMLYRCGSGGGTGSFSRRRLLVMPL